MGDAIRIEPQTLSDAATAEYVGTYENVELQTRYRLLKTKEHWSPGTTVIQT